MTAPSSHDAHDEPAPVSRNGRDAVFTRSLRYEFAGEEGRALLTSYGVAFALGIAWLLFVYFGPRTLPMQLLSPNEQAIAVTFEAFEPMPETPEVGSEMEEEVRVPTPAPTKPRARPRESGNTSAIAAAFGTTPANGSGGLVGDLSNVLRGVDVASGAGATGSGARGGKVVLGAGEGGQGSRTPGRGGIGTGIGGGGIGGVGPGGGAVSRAPVRISAPRPIDVPSVGTPRRDVGELGTFVRGRESQLRFCYNEYGLKVNPSLAGSVTASITLSGTGSVSDVGVTNRTWSGTGASETERCIAEKIREWRFPASQAGGGTFSFSFSFTR